MNQRTVQAYFATAQKVTQLESELAAIRAAAHDLLVATRFRGEFAKERAALLKALSKKEAA